MKKLIFTICLILTPISANAVYDASSESAYQYWVKLGVEEIHFSSPQGAFSQETADDYCNTQSASEPPGTYYKIEYWQGNASHAYRLMYFTCAVSGGASMVVAGRICDPSTPYHNGSSCVSDEPPPPPPPEECPEGQYYSSNYLQCVPNCPDGSYLNNNMQCVPGNDCPSDSPPACSAGQLDGVQLTSDAACINGCVAQWAGACMSGNPTSSESQHSYKTGGYYNTGQDCSGDGEGDGQGEGCRDSDGNQLACGDNSNNDDPETTEEDKPDPNDTPDPNEDGHGGDDGGDSTKPPEPEEIDCASLSDYYYNSSDPLQVPPPSIYDNCPGKVHDTATPDEEPVECSELSTWYWNSSIPFSEAPPPEYDNCPSKVVDFNEDAEGEDGICGEGEFCDTHFREGQTGICEKAPVCIEDDNYQCVTLQIRWEQFCKLSITSAFESITGSLSKLTESDAEYIQNNTTQIDLSNGFDMTGLGYSRSCPAAPSFVFMGTTFDIENDYYCLFLQYAGNLIVMFSMLAAGRMVLS